MTKSQDLTNLQKAEYFGTGATGPKLLETPATCSDDSQLGRGSKVLQMALTQDNILPGQSSSEKDEIPMTSIQDLTALQRADYFGTAATAVAYTPLTMSTNRAVHTYVVSVCTTKIHS